MQLAREEKTINSWTSKVVGLVPTDYVVWWPNNQRVDCQASGIDVSNVNKSPKKEQSVPDNHQALGTF